MKIKRFGAVLVAAMITISAGCANNQGQNQPEQQNINFTPTKWEVQVNQTIADEARQRVMNNRKEVAKAHAVNSRKELLVGVKLKAFDRFNAEKVTKSIAKHLQKLYPKRKVQVSSDKKIYQEISKVEGQVKQGEMKPKALEKRMKKINKFFKDQ